MIDAYQSKNTLISMIDNISNTQGTVNVVQSDVRQLRVELDNLKTMFHQLTQLNAEQLNYFNELIPGFSEGMMVRSKLEKVTRPPFDPKTFLQP